MTSQTTAALIMQSVLGAMRLRSLGAELNGVPIDGGHIYDFCVRGLAPDRPLLHLRIVFAGPGVVMSLPLTT